MSKKQIQYSDVFTVPFLSELVRFVLRHGIALVVAFLVLSLLLFNLLFSVSIGPSMHPTVPHNSIVVSLKTRNDFNTGDIIVFRAPDKEKGLYFKRIIGIAGDVLDVGVTGVFVNGVKLDEPYAQGVTIGQAARYSINCRVESGELYVLGDNREDSMDSRHFGPIPESDVLGKVVFVIPTPFK